MRALSLVLMMLAFAFIAWRLMGLADRLKQPPPPEAVWNEQLRSAATGITARYPKQLVSAIEAYRFYARGEGTFIDVRSAQEQRVSRIPGALLATPGGLDVTVEPWKSLVDSPIFVYCTVGERSAVFKNQMRELGWPSFNILGGICAWSWAGGPLVDDQGRATKDIHTWSADFAQCVSPDHTAIWD